MVLRKLDIHAQKHESRIKTESRMVTARGWGRI
jgi:hypothetical protein